MTIGTLLPVLEEGFYLSSFPTLMFFFSSVRVHKRKIRSFLSKSEKVYIEKNFR